MAVAAALAPAKMNAAVFGLVVDDGTRKIHKELEHHYSNGLKTYFAALEELHDPDVDWPDDVTRHFFPRLPGRTRQP